MKETKLWIKTVIQMHSKVNNEIGKIVNVNNNFDEGNIDGDNLYSFLNHLFFNKI